jgi:excisionase family DNA binding protein
MQRILDPILTTEAAHILAVSAETVRLWERAGRLPALRTSGGVRLFDRRDVERLARERREAADAIEQVDEVDAGLRLTRR